jgi:probable HAF family extracellular repeat protein
VMTNLGTLGSSSSSSSQASAINASGQIVGSSTYDGNGVSQGIRAFIYNAGQMHRLDELAPAGWVWTAASGINDFGQVALNGTANGQIQSALFTPHPDWQGGSGHWSDASHWNYAGMGAFGFAPGAPHKVNIATTQATTVTGPASAAVQRLDISSTVAQGATLDMNGGELLTVEGTNLGHGAVLTGSGRLRGRVQSQPGSLLKLALGGIAAAPLNDKLVFEQSVTLGGDLEVLWRGGFAGSVGQVFDLFDWDGGVSGSFANLALPVLTGGLVWDTSDLYGGGSLKVMALTTAVPEPQTCALALAGLLVAATRVRLIRLSRSAHRPQAHPTPAPRGG